MTTIKDIESYLQTKYGWTNTKKLKKPELLTILETLKTSQQIYLRDESYDIDVPLINKYQRPELHQLNHLAQYGWAVFPQVISTQLNQEIKTEFLNWRDKNGLNIDRNGTNNGIFHSYPIGHEEFMWKGREAEGVISAFSQIFNDTDLLTSFDVGCIYPAMAKKCKQWWHVDQGRQPLDFPLPCSYQGILALTDQPAAITQTPRGSVYPNLPWPMFFQRI